MLYLSCTEIVAMGDDSATMPKKEEKGEGGEGLGQTLWTAEGWKPMDGYTHFTNAAMLF